MTTTTAPTSHTRLYTGLYAADACREAAEEPDVSARLRKLNGARHNIEASIEDEVREWREAGASWTEVGDALGLSRQGAQQRYSKRLY